MPTGRSVVATCTALAALAGNPSDGYGGAVVAVPVPDLVATVATSESTSDATTNAMSNAVSDAVSDGIGYEIRANDPDLRRLLAATAEAYRDSFGDLPPVTISASTTIPRSVGLAGSSALVIATLRSLGGWSERRWDRLQLAELALSVERDRLGVSAGLQDRLVQAVGLPVLMRFEPVSFVPLELPDEIPLFVAWSPDAAAPSDTVHRSLRRRYDAGDDVVVRTMGELAVQAERVHRGLAAGDLRVVRDAIDRSFDLRAAMIDVGARQRRLVEIGRAGGAAVNSAGSGGSVVGLAARFDDVEQLRSDYAAIGAELVVIHPDP